MAVVCNYVATTRAHRWAIACDAKRITSVAPDINCDVLYKYRQDGPYIFWYLSTRQYVFFED